MVWSAPRAFARCSLSSLDEVTITAAPASFANCSAKIDTPPVPCTKTVSPGRMRASSKSARQAVSAAQGNVAASSKVRLEGMRLTASASRSINSCSTPGRVPPSARRRLVAEAFPSIHDWKNIGHTRSPTATLVTPSPTRATSPAPSEKGIIGSLYDPPLALHGQQVAIIQRCSAHPYNDLACARPGFGLFDQVHTVDRPFARNLPNFHFVSLKSDSGLR